jgi:hypothetical protein
MILILQRDSGERRTHERCDGMEFWTVDGFSLGRTSLSPVTGRATAIEPALEVTTRRQERASTQGMSKRLGNGVRYLEIHCSGEVHGLPRFGKLT